MKLKINIKFLEKYLANFVIVIYFRSTVNNQEKTDGLSKN